MNNFRFTVTEIPRKNKEEGFTLWQGIWYLVVLGILYGSGLGWYKCFVKWGWI